MEKFLEIFYYLALIFVFFVAFFSFFSVFYLPGNYKVFLQKDGVLEIAKEIKSPQKEINFSQKTTILSLPIFGYFVLFAKKPAGFILLILIPSLLAICQEIKNIDKERKEVQKKISQNSKNDLFLFFSLFLFLTSIFGFIKISFIGAQENLPKTIYVDDDFEENKVPYKYKTIQEAINSANPYDTIVVKEGFYEENIIIQKDNLTLKSESGPEKTIIKAKDDLKDVLYIYGANRVRVEGFTLTGAKGTFYFRASGIKIYPSSQSKMIGGRRGWQLVVEGCQIINNIITQNSRGIVIVGGKDSKISQNRIQSNEGYGIYAYSSLSVALGNNIFEENLIEGNYTGIYLYNSYGNIFTKNNLKNNYFALGHWYTDPGNFETFFENVFYLNNFLENEYPTYPLNWPVPQRWYSLEKFGYNFEGKSFGNFLGNFWSDYQGVDEDGDGIGDTPYKNPDERYYLGDAYPLISPFENYTLSQKWSFAIITDLHIGRGYEDYDGEGYGPDDEKGFKDSQFEGEDYYLTQRLKNVVNWIIKNQTKIECGSEKCPIQFLVVLGDIGDSGEKSEFLKAKMILDKLNFYDIPYIPVFGNHDVWPWVEGKNAQNPLGENYFEEIFLDENNINIKLARKMLNWQRDLDHQNYKNSTFSFRGINFIGLDFNSREKFMKKGPGVGADAVLNEINKEWLEKKLEEFKEEPVILLAHHPMMDKPPLGSTYAFSPFELSKIKKLLENNLVLFDFAGHIHSFEEFHGKIAPTNANIKYDPIASATVLTTEALMVGSNGRGVEKQIKEGEQIINGVVGDKKGILRIVKVFDKNNINPYNWETTETGDEFLAFNPSIGFGFSRQMTACVGCTVQEIPCIELKADAFCDKTKKPFIPIWDFDNSSSSTEETLTKCDLALGKHKITLTLKDQNSDFSESISKTIEIKENIIAKTINRTIDQVQNGIEFISNKAKQSFEKIRQIGKDSVYIIKNLGPLPIGIISVDFDKAPEDIELQNLIANTDPEHLKAILYLPEWPVEVERSKILFLPKK